MAVKSKAKTATKVAAKARAAAAAPKKVETKPEPKEAPAGATAAPQRVEGAFRQPFGMKSTDLRDTIGVSTAAMSDILKKAGASYLDSTSRTGAARLVHPEAVRRILTDRGFSFPLKKSGRAHVIAIQITKGGAGKTTTSYVVATRISALGGKVLVVDADPQSNLTTAFELEQYGLDIDEETAILADLFEKKRAEESLTVEDLIISVTPNLHIVPSTLLNSNLELRLQGSAINVLEAMRQKFAAVMNKYDYIIFDCAPSLSSTNAAIACFANTVVLPVYPDKLCVSGLNQTLGELARLKSQWPSLQRTMNERIIFSRFDGREVTSVHYMSQLYRDYPEKMYANYIRTSTELKNSIHFNRHLFEATRSGVAEDFDKLVKEIIGLDTVTLRKKPLARRGAEKSASAG